MAESVLWGAMDILFVVLAIDVLELGPGWVGYFNAAEMASLALGALLIPPLVALGGSKAALIGAGLLLPVIAVASTLVSARREELARLATDATSP